ncbi:MAG: 2'-5' RNA ligase family protein [bacterium]
MNEKIQGSIICFFPDNEIDGLEKFRKKYIKSPGKAVPFHITLMYDFLLPHEIDKSVINKLNSIAKSIPKFNFYAKPLSSFPANKVLYLSPSPVTPIEELTEKLYNTFPNYSYKKRGFPIFHMTIALGNPIEETQDIIKEYFQQFGEEPLALKAGSIGIYINKANEWIKYLSIELGDIH